MKSPFLLVARGPDPVVLTSKPIDLDRFSLERRCWFSANMGTRQPFRKPYILGHTLLETRYERAILQNDQSIPCQSNLRYTPYLGGSATMLRDVLDCERAHPLLWVR
ncbi:MAG: hypothetical protein A2289_08340 [Deltaproteobacteria bacterium RIFOXYA12_FULL_58_15]|nr:MAG: hypothetical protein A2289_08340 [Deltaproteobacteria bacterium RIFOXYA12_FULL_58_15]